MPTLFVRVRTSIATGRGRGIGMAEFAGRVGTVRLASLAATIAA